MSANPQTASEIVKSLSTRYKAEKAPADYEKTMHFKISGANGGQFTVNVKDGVCSVAEGLSGEANCVITTKDSVYEDVELGRSNPQMAVMMGKIKLSNIGEMLTFMNLFTRLS